MSYVAVIPRTNFGEYVSVVPRTNFGGLGDDACESGTHWDASVSACMPDATPSTGGACAYPYRYNPYSGQCEYAPVQSSKGASTGIIAPFTGKTFIGIMMEAVFGANWRRI